MEGEVYVPVQASATNFQTMSIDGSQGELNTWVNIHWTLSGGISGQFPFDSLGIHVDETTTAEQINKAISDYIFITDFKDFGAWKQAECLTPR